MNNQTDIYTTINSNDIVIKRCNELDFAYPSEYQALLLEVALYFENDLITLSWFEYGDRRSYSVTTKSGYEFAINNHLTILQFNGSESIGMSVIGCINDYCETYNN